MFMALGFCRAIKGVIGSRALMCEAIVAAQKDDRNTVESLLRSGLLHPDAVDAHGSTLLHYAVAENAFAVVEILIECGARLDVCDEDMRSLIDVAASRDRGSMIRYLHERGADLNARDRYGRTAMHTAARRGSLEAIRVLLQMDVSVKTTDDYGDTPLTLATPSSVPVLDSASAWFTRANSNKG